MDVNHVRSGRDVVSGRVVPFRAASDSLMAARDEGEALSALTQLRSCENSAASWEAVRAWVFNKGALSERPGEELKSRIVEALASGSDSQRDELGQLLLPAVSPISWTHQVAAQIIGSEERFRIEWFRDLLGDQPLRRLRAMELLCAVPAGGLRNSESRAVAGYLFRQCQADLGYLLEASGPEALAAVPFSAERIERFFASHSGAGALAEAERALELSLMNSFLASRVLVEYGDQGDRETVFEFLRKQKQLLFDGFELWSGEALISVEEKLAELVSSMTASSDVLVSAIRALGNLPNRGRYESLVIKAAKEQPWNLDLIQASAGLLTKEGISDEALQFAYEVLLPSSTEAFWLKSPRSWFIFNRPDVGLVNVALSVTEAAQLDGRFDLYRQALQQRDISGTRLSAAARAMVATCLPSADPGAQRELRQARSSTIDALVPSYSEQLCSFASRAPLDIAVRLLDAVVARRMFDSQSLQPVSMALGGLWGGCASEEERAAVVRYVASLADRFSSRAVVREVCAEFYGSLGGGT